MSTILVFENLSEIHNQISLDKLKFSLKDEKINFSYFTFFSRLTFFFFKINFFFFLKHFFMFQMRLTFDTLLNEVPIQQKATDTPVNTSLKSLKSAKFTTRV